MTVARAARRRPERFHPEPHDRILAFAPHPDDDALGCGGTLALAARCGAAVRVAYLTDGGGSHANSRLVSRDALRDVREREALTGLAALGIDQGDATFFRARDGELDPDDAMLAQRLVRLLRAFVPTIVLAPFERDAHPDHRAAAALVARALAVAASEARVLHYAVWLAHRGAASDQWTAAEGTFVVVDTRTALAQKRRAIAAHRSQFGRVVRDDPTGFRLPHDVVVRACAGEERFLARDARGTRT